MQVPLYPVNNVPGLYPHDQYDILLRRMGYDLGAASVRMYVAIAQDRLDSYLPAVKRRITAVHPNVTIQPVQGRTRGGKRESECSCPVEPQTCYKGCCARYISDATYECSAPLQSPTTS